MIPTRLSILLLLFSSLIFSCTSKKDELKRAIESEFRSQEGVFALAFEDLSTGDTLMIRGDETFHAASTMKTPVMIEIYKKVAEGKLSLDDSVVIRNEFKSIVDGSVYHLKPEVDSELTIYAQLGSKRTLYSLVYDMIIYSSNMATNIIIDMADPKETTQTMHSLGAKDILVLRGVEDQKAFDKGLVNTTTAYDQMVIYEKLAKEEVLSREASQAMTSILLDQKSNEVIPANLPSDVKVAHKTGSFSGVVRHDCGIVFLPDGRKYVLVLLSKELKDDAAATKMMANVSALVYEYIARK